MIQYLDKTITIRVKRPKNDAIIVGALNNHGATKKKEKNHYATGKIEIMGDIRQ